MSMLMEVNCCQVISSFSAVTLNDIRETSEKCEIMKTLKRAIQTGKECKDAQEIKV